jgi:methylphosphotriester-DNA--protein-cysteine methyltransferase
MIRHNEISDAELKKRIRQGKILIGGNIKLKIYGKLNCQSGKRMKRENRIFFKSVREATKNGFRPCGHCLKGEYKNWRQGIL